MVIEIATSEDGTPRLAVHGSREDFLKAVADTNLEKIKYEMPLPGEVYYDISCKEYRFLIEGEFLAPVPKTIVVEWTLGGGKV